MQLKLSFLLIAAVLPGLSGCVAIAIPVVAAGMMGKSEVDRRKAEKQMVAGGAKMLGSTTMETKTPTSDNVYSGQGGAIDDADAEMAVDTEYLSRFFKPIQDVPSNPYNEFTNYALDKASKFEAGEGVTSVILVPRVDIIKPRMMACSGLPLAVVIDLDDSENNDWSKSEILYRQNGLAESLQQLRDAEIRIIWISNTSSVASDRISTLLNEAGLAAAGVNDFLFLDRGGSDRKQERRWEAARNYCVVAAAGDKRGDFDELYDYLREPDAAITLERMFGRGWFLTPAPLTSKSGVESEDLNINTDKKEG